MSQKDYKQQESVQYKCPNCGAPLKFDPATRTLSCEHCGSCVNFDKNSNVVERDFKELVTFKVWKDSDVTTYRCSNCGAVSVSPRTTLSTECPYCGSSVVIDDQTGSIVMPDTVIPFELTKKDAAQQLAKWRRKKIFAPRKFIKNTKEDSIKGVYIPMWTFDADTATYYQGTLGKHRTRTRRVNGKTVTETYTEWFHVDGVFDATFDDVTVRANDNINEADFRNLQPFGQEKYMAFDSEYLAGFLADHYTLEPQDAFEQAKSKMLIQIRRGIVDRYNADVEGDLDTEMHVLSKSFKYVLVPVYIATTKYSKKLYHQYVSGVFYNREKKLSKVSGKAPVSGWKVFFTVLFGLGLFAGLAYLLFAHGGGGNFEVLDDWWGMINNFSGHLLN